MSKEGGFGADLHQADMQRTRGEDIRGTAHVRSSGGKAEGPD